ncbi:3-phosphoshikimate 1-carboxyvinyltransferase [Adhaeretor mobilis]|uniref:3-phosphoshikimate 1-carboxyvinyltransferase n=1 Tax=Adhaeretor mobilis TaxID=1930276 RepID=A0A517MXD2_9BACT|nr:3-phosphoshikimate 1-carboxyvinyltransferase [Adhaeretor mobilis]QDS99523.1 3-phosphoshikimate 1-carboxyvinyltransferase [Adhaeretor mobilis]
MSRKIEIMPLAGPLDATIRPPGSKSLTNRALICAALASGQSILTGALDSEDTQVMIASLRALGIEIESSEGGKCLSVQGCDGKLPRDRAELYVENSGTSMRFLTALATLGNGKYTLDGIARMHERPIADLRDALQQLGAEISLSETGCPPVVVTAKGLEGGVAQIRGDISSQFLSGLMMAAPYADESVTIDVKGTLVSVPYVEMTKAVMESFSAKLRATSGYEQIVIESNNPYQATEYGIEPDASAASYFFAAAAVTGGKVEVQGLHENSLQGDVKFCDCLAQMGCQVNYGSDCTVVQGSSLRGVDLDMNAISDTMQTLAVVALFAEGTTRIRNVAHVRHKETDRIAAVAAELRKLGASVNEFEDGLEITPGEFTPAEIATYNDHRMAMSFAVAGLRQPSVVILDPECVNKTYPQFFADFAALGRG